MGFGLSDIFGGGSESTTAPSKIYEAQDPFLQDLYSRAQLASYGNTGQNYANQISNNAMGGYNSLLQGGNMYNQSGLQNIASGDTQNQYLNSAINSGLGQISDNFNRNIMPGINTGSAMTNTSGGSRQGIAQGLAASDANRQATDFVNQMQSGNFQAGLQNQLSAYGQLSQNDQLQNQAQMYALGQAPQLSNLGFGSQYGNLSAYSGLLGSPAVLGGGGSTSQTGGLFAPIGVNVGGGKPG